MFKSIISRKYLVFLITMVFVHPLIAAPANFTFMVNTQLGTGASFTIPTYGTGYNYDIDCDNDGKYEATGQTGNYTCDYNGIGGSGNYTIQIKDAAGNRTGFPRVRFNDLGEANEIIKVVSWGQGLWDNMDSAFKGAVNMTVTAQDRPNFSNVTSMKEMFRDAALANPYTRLWDTSKVTDMNAMFRNAAAANPDVSRWDVSKVSSMRRMFEGAIKANPDTSLWDTSQVEKMNDMFKGAVSATPDTSLWDTSQVTRMDYMFDGALLAIPDTSNWDTSKVESMDYMFRNASFANPDTRNWNIQSVKLLANGIVSENRYGFKGMFSGIKLNINSYDALLNKFASTTNYSDLELGAGNSSYCTATSARFYLENQKQWTITDAGQNCNNETNDFVIVVNTENPGDTSSTQFRIPVLIDLNNPHNYAVSCQDNGAFNAGGLSGSYSCNYNEPGTYRIRIVDLTNNGSGFPNIYFNNAGDRLKIVDIRQWGTSHWKTMRSAFWGAANMIVTAKDAPDLSQVSSLENMFRGASKVNPDTKNWDVSHITTMKRMFAGDYVANPDTSLWNTSSIGNLSYMFYHAYSANPDMSNWNISQVNTMSQMFNDVTLPIASYDAALINFDSQAHNQNVNFTAGNSMYCDGLNAHVNLLNDGWSIADAGQECTPNQPTYIPTQLSAPTDNTPLVKVFCSSINNTIKIFFTGVNYNFTQVASHICTIDNNYQSFSFTHSIDDGNFRVQTTETKNGDESMPSTLPLSSTFFVDTTTPDPTWISLSPNPAANGTTVFLQLSGIEWRATVSITGMICSPSLADQIGNVDCSGVVGQNGLDGTDNTITIIDDLGNTNANNSTGLKVTVDDDLIFANGFETQ